MFPKDPLEDLSDGVLVFRHFLDVHHSEVSFAEMFLLVVKGGEVHLAGGALVPVTPFFNLDPVHLVGMQDKLVDPAVGDRAELAKILGRRRR